MDFLNENDEHSMDILRNAYNRYFLFLLQIFVADKNDFVSI